MATILLGSILLEPNRWAKAKTPTIRVSEWAARAKDAGIDGIELWENHWRMADEAERQALKASKMVRYYNTYAPFDDRPESRAARKAAADAARELGAVGVKFNVGSDKNRRDEYLRVAEDWARSLPANCRALCECHPGTVLETPEAAAEAFPKWPPERVAAIVHPFTQSPERLGDWVRLLGPRVVHGHVQIRTEKDVLVRLDRKPREAEAALAALQPLLKQMTFTLEFTEGTRTPDDKPEVLFRNALADLEFLRKRLPPGA